MEKETRDLREAIPDPIKRLRFLRLTIKSLQLYRESKAIADKRKPITEEIKRLCEEFKLERVGADGMTVSFYEQESRSVNAKKLMKKGVPKRIVEDCTDVRKSTQLRISERGQNGGTEEESGTESSR